MIDKLLTSSFVKKFTSLFELWIVTKLEELKKEIDKNKTKIELLEPGTNSITLDNNYKTAIVDIIFTNTYIVVNPNTGTETKHESVSSMTIVIDLATDCERGAEKRLDAIKYTANDNILRPVYNKGIINKCNIVYFK